MALLLMAAWHLAIGDTSLCEVTLDELIAHEPNMAVARLMRAECLNRRGASTVERWQAYRDVLRLQPGNAAVAALVEKLQGAVGTAAPRAEIGWQAATPAVMPDTADAAAV